MTGSLADPGLDDPSLFSPNRTLVVDIAAEVLLGLRSTISRVCSFSTSGFNFCLFLGDPPRASIPPIFVRLLLDLTDKNPCFMRKERMTEVKRVVTVSLFCNVQRKVIHMKV